MNKKQNLIKDPRALSIADVSYWRFNVNRDIRVRLTDLGYQRLADLHNEYIGKIPKWEERDAIYYKKKADKDGYTTFQMWTFMECYGEVTQIGYSMYYETEILIDCNDIDPCVQ